MPSASGAPRCLELGRDGRGALGVAAGDGDARAGARQRLRGSQPDARRAARDQAATALESQLHRAIVAAWRPATRLLECEAMPILLLVRHGETALNWERRWQGQHDAPLSAGGPRRGAGAGGAHRRRPARARSTPPISRARARRRRRSPAVTGLEPIVRRALARGRRRRVAGPHARGGRGALSRGLRALARRRHRLGAGRVVPRDGRARAWQAARDVVARARRRRRTRSSASPTAA